jgi:23S rRNA (cytidine1920-2'-O)/16S rRNA (cytidine1409-2'-O)-methyltransferase
MSEETRHRRAAPKRVRLDVAVVERGLESSRERARRLIVAGEVTVDGVVTRAPSTLVARDAAIAVGKALPYVSRGGLKLAHALDRFGIDVTGRVCLDAGASTGGFTDVLLQRGARRVYTVDVGKGLLAWSLRQDPRVVVMEEVNVRYLRLGGEEAPPSIQANAANAANAAPTLPERVDLAVVDVAFISLRLVLPAITGVLAPDGDLVALVKPQFEAGQADVGKGGVVRDPRVHRRVLGEALDVVRAQALHPRGLTASPIRGQAGNVEFLLWASASAHSPSFDDAAAIAAALAEVPR